MKAVAALSMLAVLAASPALGDNPMSGRWYTEGVENGLHLQSILENKPDGTFVKDIHNGTDCDAISNWIETGTWTFDGKQYVEVTQTVNGQKVDRSLADHTDRFDVTRVDDTHVTLEDTKTQIAWPFARVDDDYAMPSPKDCTV